jgi:hypothetical protein
LETSQRADCARLCDATVCPARAFLSATTSDTSVSKPVRKRKIILISKKAVGLPLNVCPFCEERRRTIWIADAHRGDGKRFLVHADEKLTAFIELEAAVRPGVELS